MLKENDVICQPGLYFCPLFYHYGKDHILLDGVFKNYYVNNNFNQGKEFKIPTTFQKKKNFI